MRPLPVAALLVVLGVAVAAGASPALAAPAPPPPPPPPAEPVVVQAPLRAPARPPSAAGYDRRTLAVTLPVWIPGVTGTFAKGTTTVRPERPSTDLGVASDAVTELEFAFVGRVDARIDRTVFFGDVFGVRVQQTADFVVNALDAEASLQAIMGRLLVGRRLVEGCPDPCRWALDVDALAGARLYHVRAELDEPAALAFDVDELWVDPVVAGRAIVSAPGRRFALTAFADVGGFGVGSDVSWSASLELSARLGSRVDVVLGYAWLGVDREVERGDGDVAIDIRLQGPVLGVTFRF
jgi:hypothetical protein